MILEDTGVQSVSPSAESVSVMGRFTQVDLALIQGGLDLSQLPSPMGTEIGNRTTVDLVARHGA